jgi:hypothetical protein
MSLDRWIGDWRMSGPEIDGVIRFEWMEGGFFLIQHFDLVNFGTRYQGVEYTGFDSNTMYYWFGEQGADTYSVGIFNDDGSTISGRWRWSNPDGTTAGYTYTLQRQ